MKINNVYVYGLEESLIAASYPMLARVFTEKEFEALKEDLWSAIACNNLADNKDIQRGIRLANAPAGSGHDCWLKGVIVQFDCNAPQYFWQQLQRYHFIDFVSL